MRRTVVIVSLLACVMLLFAGAASAGLNTWTGTGPAGAAVRAVLVDPTPGTIYIGTVGSGVFKSTNGGATWAQSDPAGPLATRTVRSLVFGAAGTIYAGSDNAVDSTSGVFQSINGGTSWTALSAQPPNRKVQALAWDGANLYAGTREETVGTPPVLFTGGVYKWNGATWTPMNSGLPNQSSRRVQALAIDSRTGAVYLGTQGEGVFKSVDGGATWTRIDNPANQGFRSDCLEKPEILALAVDETIALVGPTGATLYAGATGQIGTTGCHPTPAEGGHKGQGPGLFRFVPGADCNDIPSIFGCWDRRMAGAFEDLLPTTVSTQPWSIALKTNGSPTRIYIGTDIGVFTSNDSAGSWDGVPRIDLPDDLLGPVRALGIDPLASCPGGTVNLYAGTAGRGMFSRCPNLPVGEDPWTLTNTGLTALRAQAVAVGSRGGSKAVFAGLSGGGVITSINNGSTWQDTPETGSSVRAFAIDPTTPTTIYAATGKGVIRSLTGGDSWALASAGLPTTATPQDPPRTVRWITVDPATPTTLYAAVGGVYRSVNSGVTWTSVNGNLPPAVTTNDGTVSAIVIDSFSPGVNPTWGNLYAAVDGSGVYASSDGGVTWTLVAGIPVIPAEDLSVATLALDPLPPVTLYAGTSTGKVFKSQIGFGPWTAFSTAGLPSQAITSLVVKPGTPSRIYAGINGINGGVYVITSNGSAWASMNNGLSSPGSLNVAALAYDPQGAGTMYAATLGSGIFDFEFDSGGSQPFVIIQSPAPAFSTGTSPVMVTGVASNSFNVFWSTNRGRAGFASGTSTWSASVPLEPGQNIVTITAVDDSFNQGSASITGTLTAPTFADVPSSHPFFSFIEALFDSGLTGGCSTNPPLYCPDAGVSRDQMALFLLRGIHGAGYQPPNATGTFTDVPLSQPFAKWIEQLAREGITAGCSTTPPMYCPGAGVTRGQMAVFLLRAKHGTGYQPPAATGTFTDVPVTHPFAKWIEQLAREGITAGCSPTTYCPDVTVTRGQMAVFLVRTFNLPM